uniref:Replication protein A subunit n=1 Tax=Araucaria cunninghamii TaxID=56994 RepID=A0A0D6R679_ARACU
MAVARLTPNAIAAMNNGDVDLRPLVQVLDIRQIATAQSVQERYRMVLSDGVNMQQAMLATQLNPCVKSGQLQKGSVVQLMEYICNSVQNRKIIIVLNMEVVIPKCDIVGESKQLTDANANSQQQQQQRAAVPMHSAPQTQSMPQAQPAQFYGGSINTMGPNSNILPQSMGVANIAAPTSSHMSGAGPGSYVKPANVPAQPVQSSTVGGEAGRGMNPNPYGRPIVAPAYHPPPMYSSRGPIARNEAPARIIPIAALNPYQGRWTIKARVTAKGDLRRFNNARGDGKVFSFDLLDSDGGEIRVTCFNAVADQFYDRIESGRVYTISKGSLKPAQKNFNHLKNDWEIFLESSSTVEACLEEDNSIPTQQFNFRPIREVEDAENNSMVDIIGIVVSINPSNTIMRKNGTETQKRTLQLKDTSACSVEVTMWGGFCNKEGQQLQDMCDSGTFPILAVKAGRISDFSGKSVGTISTSQLFINPDLPEAHCLRHWFDTEGKNIVSQSITKETSSGGRVDMRKTVAQIKDEGLGRSDKPDWISVKATISFIKVDNFCYTACPMKIGDRQCNKKVNNNGDGTWHCERCDRSFPECDYRYLLQLQVQDHTGLTWVTAFQEAGEEIMGVTAKELYMVKHEEQDDAKFGEIIRKVIFNQYIFKLKVKEETYSDEQRLRCTVTKTERLDCSSESKFLLDQISKISNAKLNNLTAERTSNLGTNTGSYDAGFNNLGYSGSGSGSSSANNYGTNNLAASHVGQSIGGGGGYYVNSGGYGGTHNPSSNMYSGSASCYKCGKMGHLPNDCPSSGRISAAHGSGNAGGGYGMRTGGYGGGY